MKDVKLDEFGEIIEEELICDGSEWRDETYDKLVTFALANGWDIDADSLASTGSRYVTFSRPIDSAENEYAEIKYRVSNHADLYCRADFSLVYPPNQSGDDIEDVEWAINQTARPVIQAA